MSYVSHAAVVVPCTSKIIKNFLTVFLKEEKISYKMVYHTLHLDIADRQKSRWKVSSLTNQIQKLYNERLSK